MIEFPVSKLLVAYTRKRIGAVIVFRRWRHYSVPDIHVFDAISAVILLAFCPILAGPPYALGKHL